jgi:inhibitor of KinA sporulation pathway (predicted exonuclease)
MKLYGLPLEGTHHRGHDDAWNIAAVLWEVLKKLRG